MITREELVKKYKIAISKINTLKNKVYDYKTNRACEPFGRVRNMTIKEVVQAGASVHEGDASITASIERYGVRPEDLKGDNARSYCGFTMDEWDHDFTLRVEEIHDKEDLEKYQNIADKLAKNFTDDDRFMIEMAEIDALGMDLDESEE